MAFHTHALTPCRHTALVRPCSSCLAVCGIGDPAGTRYALVNFPAGWLQQHYVHAGLHLLHMMAKRAASPHLPLLCFGRCRPDHVIVIALFAARWHGANKVIIGICSSTSRACLWVFIPGCHCLCMQRNQPPCCTRHAGRSARSSSSVSTTQQRTRPGLGLHTN